jgi:hypothetical protein
MTGLDHVKTVWLRGRPIALLLLFAYSAIQNFLVIKATVENWDELRPKIVAYPVLWFFVHSPFFPLSELAGLVALLIKSRAAPILLGAYVSWGLVEAFWRGGWGNQAPAYDALALAFGCLVYALRITPSRRPGPAVPL